MQADSGDRRRLHSWKEIAAFLGVTPRTAQSWRKSRQLPVHVCPGPSRSGVYAYADEIEAWLASARVPTVSPDSNREGPAPGASAARSWAPWIGAGIAVAGVALWIAIRPWPLRSAGPPTRLDLRGDTLQVYGPRDDLLWQERFADLDLLSYEAEGWRGSSTLFDVDSDGEPDVLFSHFPGDLLAATGTLICFDPAGNIRWRHGHGRRLSREADDFSATFRALLVAPVTVAGEPRILSIAGHNPRYPCEVALIDPRTGATLDTYYHPGYLYTARTLDVDRDGEDELLLGGVNNPGPGIGHPVLAILDLPFSKRDPGPGAHSDFFGNPGPRERAYVMFPRVDAFEATESVAAVRELGSPGPGRVMVQVKAGATLLLYYTLTLSPTGEIAVEEITVSDALREEHNDLSRSGRLDHELSAAEVERFAGIRRLETAPNGNDPRWRDPSAER